MITSIININKIIIILLLFYKYIYFQIYASFLLLLFLSKKGNINTQTTKWLREKNKTKKLIYFSRAHFFLSLSFCYRTFINIIILFYILYIFYSTKFCCCFLCLSLRERIFIYSLHIVNFFASCNFNGICASQKEKEIGVDEKCCITSPQRHNLPH